MLKVMSVRLGGGRGASAYNPDENLEHPSVIVRLGLSIEKIIRAYVRIITIVLSQLWSLDLSSIFRKGMLSIEKRQALL